MKRFLTRPVVLPLWLWASWGLALLCCSVALLVMTVQRA